MKRKAISLFLTLCMMLSLLPGVIPRAEAAGTLVVTKDAVLDMVRIAEAAYDEAKQKHYGASHYDGANYSSHCAGFAYEYCLATSLLARQGVKLYNVNGGHITGMQQLLNMNAGTLYIKCSSFHENNEQTFLKKWQGLTNAEGQKNIKIADANFTPQRGDFGLMGFSKDTTWHVVIMSDADTCVYASGNTLYKTSRYDKDQTSNITGRQYFDHFYGYFRFNTCDHETNRSKINDLGICKNCGAQCWTETADGAGIYIGSPKIVLARPGRALPYDVADAKDRVYAGRFYEVVGSTVNHWGGDNGEHLWYHVKSEEKGQDFWIFHEYLDYLMPLPTKIEVNDPIDIGTFRCGDPNGYTVKGTITSKYPIKSIAVKFMDTNGNQASKPRTTYADLKGKTPTWVDIETTVDPVVFFTSLPVGTWQYWYIIEDVNGNSYTHKGKFFDVVQAVPSACAVPTVTGQTDVDGGRTYTVSTSTAGATVSLSANGQTASGVGSASITMTSSGRLNATASKSGMKSSSNGWDVSIPQCARPSINTHEMTEQGLKYTISHTGGETVYYSVNGGAYQVYYDQALFLTQSSIVRAYAKKPGQITSGTATESITVTAPSAPVLKTLSTPADIAVGNSVSLSWQKDSNATAYTVTVTKDGAAFLTERVTEAGFSFAADEAGAYTATVSAENIAGKSGESNAVSVTAHDPLQVRFFNYNGTLLSEQTVRYGEDASAPPVAPRKGYTFAGWDKALQNITRDTDITARYDIITYTVRFYDCNGTRLIDTQYIDFDNPIDGDTPRGRVTLRTGYAFVGWHISESDAGSDQDLEHIDSDMSLVAVEEWADAVLPVVITNVTASRNAGSTGYDVQFDASVAPADVCGADTKKVKFIVTLKSREDQTLGVSVVSVNLTSDTQELTQSIFVSYDGSYLADKVEVTTVGIDGNDRTGGALSRPVSATPTITVIWTDWLTEEELTALGKSPSDVGMETKTQYRYTDSHRYTDTVTTTASTAPEKNGWTCTNPNNSANGWYDWSGWSDSCISSSATRQVDTQQVQTGGDYSLYRYGRWQSGSGWNYCSATCQRYYGGTPYVAYTGWSTDRYPVTGAYYTCAWISGYTHNHIGVESWASNGNPVWASYLINGEKYFWEESQYVAPSYKTQYRYRDQKFIYNYERWEVKNPTEWSDTQVTGYSDTNDRRDVETRTLYRYITNDTSVTELVSDVEQYSCSGTLDVSEDLAGKTATVLVYKDVNSDPTEPQLEYVGTTDLTAGNAFAFTFRPKEAPTAATGDFTIALALQGSGNVVNVGKVKAPAQRYSVAFYSYDGTELFPAGQSETQQVEEGCGAALPAAPARPGYRFVCWSTDVSYVQRDLSVTPVYVPEEYSVVFVDHENETVTLKTDFRYGETLTIPDTPSCEGMDFAGWQVVSNRTGQVLTGDEITVTDDLIVTARWTPRTFTVKFLGEDGQPVSTQTVAWGKAAALPAAPAVSEGKVFLGWATAVNWWSVTEDVTVSPLIVWAETTMQPMTAQLQSLGPDDSIEFTCEEGAQIYYTMDGSEPDIGSENTFRYEGPILVTEDTIITAIAYKENKNPSETVTVEFWYIDGITSFNEIDTLDVGTYNIVAEPGKTVTLNLAIENNPGLLGYLFYIDADPGVFCIPYDEETEKMAYAPGPLCAEGVMLMGAYQEGRGWPVLWFSPRAVQENGTLCTVTLQVYDDVETATYPVTVRYSPANTFDEEYISQDIPGLSVGFSNSSVFKIGDVDGDEEITNKDVLLIARFFIHQVQIAEERQFLMDVNGDGSTNISDAVYLARYLIGLETVLGGA